MDENVGVNYNSLTKQIVIVSDQNIQQVSVSDLSGRLSQVSAGNGLIINVNVSELPHSLYIVSVFSNNVLTKRCKVVL